MILSDNTIVNTTIKFLGPVRPTYNRQGEVDGAYFIFNAHKLFYDTVEQATTIRAEIAENVPPAEEIANVAKAGQWEIPPEAEELAQGA